MGTRADFYVGIRKPIWIGSLYKDGFPWNIPSEIFLQTNATMYEEEVVDFLTLNDGIIRSNGDTWPWPWEDSQLTDYSYLFSNQSGIVYAYSMVEKFTFNPLKIVQGEDLNQARVLIPIKFPNMGVGYGPNTAKAV